MVESISAQELKKKLDSGDDFKLINVLTEESFRKEHIPGSINIPYTEIAQHKDELDKDEEIIVHCSDEKCDASPTAANKLEKLGYEDVKDFEGGMREWKEKGYKTVSGDDR
jgi:rhodanese-related sulfurtransferase